METQWKEIPSSKHKIQYGLIITGTINVKPFPKDIGIFHCVMSPDDKLFADVRAAGTLNTRGST